MDKLMNEFTVSRPIDEAWAVLTDVERIAPCMPGAQLEEIEGDIFRGVVKVKLGAISTAFKGQATFVERDDAAHRAVLHGEGRDTTGKGNADAMITATAVSVSATETKVVVETDLRITGKVAQFGRGIMGDVSKKLMAQFATNLNTMLAESSGPADEVTTTQTTDESPATIDADKTDDTEPTVAVAAGAAAPVAAAAAAGVLKAPAVRKIDGPANEPIDLSGVAGGAVLKRLVPLFGGLAVLLFVLRRFRNR